MVSASTVGVARGMPPTSTPPPLFALRVGHWPIRCPIAIKSDGLSMPLLGSTDWFSYLRHKATYREYRLCLMTWKNSHNWDIIPGIEIGFMASAHSTFSILADIPRTRLQEAWWERWRRAACRPRT